MQEQIKGLIPKKLRSRFTNRPILQKIVKNIGWLTGERILELLVALTVGIWVARYLGPSDYGLMSFAIAFCSLFSPFINLGLDTILHRDLVDNLKNRDLLLGTVFRIKLFSSILIGFLMILIILLIKPGDLLLISMVGVFALGNVVSSFGGIGSYFHAKIESSQVVKSSSIALILSNLIRVIFILFNFSVFYFVLASLTNTVIMVLIQFYYYSIKCGLSILQWKFDLNLAKKMLSLSWPLIFSSVFSIIYLNIDQFMIGILLNNYELGIYVVAVKISLVFNFFPGVVSMSLFPALMNARKTSSELYFRNLQKMFDFFTWFSILLIIPVFVASNFIIDLLYGSEYSGAGFILSILIWIVLAVFMKSGVDVYINSEKLYKINLYSTLIGAIINIVLNLLLIPTIGISGAAISTVFSYFIVGYVNNLFFKETRKLFKMQLKSFNLVRVLKENLNL